MRAPVLAIVGPGEGATAQDLSDAESLGTLAARRRWVVMTGGVASGVMDAAARGARAAGGTVIGILPSGDTAHASPDLTVAVVTALGQARNNLIVLSSDAVAVCGLSAGTAVEASLAVRAGRPLAFIAASDATRAFFEALAPASEMYFVDAPGAAIDVLGARIDQRR